MRHAHHKISTVFPHVGQQLVGVAFAVHDVYDVRHFRRQLGRHVHGVLPAQRLAIRIALRFLLGTAGFAPLGPRPREQAERTQWFATPRKTQRIVREKAEQLVTPVAEQAHAFALAEVERRRVMNHEYRPRRLRAFNLLRLMAG